MDYLFSIFLGIVQGLTEFLPISSSGHLVLFHHIFRSELLDNLNFDVFLHAGTLLALVVYFWNEILKYILAFFQSLVKWEIKTNFNQRVAWYLFVASLPVFIAGYFFEEIINVWFRNVYLVAGMLILFGFILGIVDYKAKKNTELSSLKSSQALIIGLAQIIALIPGVSRSGITIIGGLTQGLTRKEAAHFAFLLAIPAIFGAMTKTLLNFDILSIWGEGFLIYILGFIAAFTSGFLCIKYFLKFLQQYSLIPFVVYRILLGIFIVIIISFV